MGRVVSTTSPDTGTVTMVYDKNGNPVSRTDAKGITVRYVYDELNRPIAVNFPDESQNIVYTYDQGTFGKGRLTGITDPAGSLAFEYDGRGRLTGKIGNRTRRTINDLIEDYTYTSGTSRLESISGDDTVNYTYDANSNTTGIGSRTLVYNQSNRLIRVEDSGVTLGEYTYNALGQRVIKEVDGVTTVFHYDFDGLLIGESASNGIFTTEYLYQTGKLLAMVDVRVLDHIVVGDGPAVSLAERGLM